MTTPADPHVNPEAVEAPPIAVVGPESAIADRMEQLRKTIAELTPEVTKLQQEQKSTWAWLKGGAGFVVFDILVTVAGLILGINVYSVSHQNDALISQLQAQQARLATSIHETCNLYGTFINFYSPAARDRFAGGPVQYDQLYLVLQKSADNLNCGVKHVVPGT
jgi:hypothetical protein